MVSFADALILEFDDDLYVEARTVLARTGEPQNAFEVAVILETLGYHDTMAQGLGFANVFELAQRVWEVVGDFAPTRDGQVEAPPTTADLPRPRRFLGLGVLYSVPWITAIVVLLTTGAGFWSSRVFTPPLSSGLTLSLFLGLVASGPFVQAFTRRATFHLLQGRLALVRWAIGWMLGAGALVCAAVVVGAYLLLERVFAAYTPGTTSSFLEVGLAISALQLAFAPLYALRAFRALTVAVALGAAVLVVGLGITGTGLFVDPFSIIRVQLASIATMVLVAVLAASWLLRGGGDRAGARPRHWPVVRSVSPYALYGGGYFALIVVDQLVAGGLWSGHFRYESLYQTTVGIALIVVLPLFAYIVAVSECFPRFVTAELASLRVTEVERLRKDAQQFLWRHTRTLVVSGVVAAGCLLIGVVALDRHLGAATIVAGHLWLLVGAMTSYVLLCVGMMSSQLLFALSRPSRPAIGVVGGVAASLLVGGVASLWWGGQAGGMIGLLTGTATFAAVSVVAVRSSFKQFDATYYEAF